MIEFDVNLYVCLGGDKIIDSRILSRTRLNPIKSLIKKGKGREIPPLVVGFEPNSWIELAAGFT